MGVDKNAKSRQGSIEVFKMGLVGDSSVRHDRAFARLMNHERSGDDVTRLAARNALAACAAATVASGADRPGASGADRPGACTDGPDPSEVAFKGSAAWSTITRRLGNMIETAESMQDDCVRAQGRASISGLPTGAGGPVSNPRSVARRATAADIAMSADTVAPKEVREVTRRQSTARKSFTHALAKIDDTARCRLERGSLLDAVAAASGHGSVELVFSESDSDDDCAAPEVPAAPTGLGIAASRHVASRRSSGCELGFRKSGSKSSVGARPPRPPAQSAITALGRDLAPIYSHDGSFVDPNLPPNARSSGRGRCDER